CGLRLSESVTGSPRLPKANSTGMGAPLAKLSLRSCMGISFGDGNGKWRVGNGKSGARQEWRARGHARACRPIPHSLFPILHVSHTINGTGLVVADQQAAVRQRLHV